MDAALGKTLTIDNLKKRQVVAIEWCICKSTGKPSASPLPCCLGVLEYSVCYVSWVMPRGVVELLASWQDRFGRSSNRVIWNAIPHCLVWCLWCERNARTFEGSEKSIVDLKLSFLQSLFEWMTVSGLFSFANLFEMFDSCSLCA